MSTSLRTKKRQAAKLLESAIGYLNCNTPHCSSWHKKHYRKAFEHWKAKDLSFIGNKAMFLAHQGQMKGYRAGTTHASAYSQLWSIALGCYFYTDPRVDSGPMRPFFLTEIFVSRLRVLVDQKLPKDLKERVWFYQRRAIYTHYLHTLGLDQGPVNRIDRAPLDYQDALCSSGQGQEASV